jgi:cytochrome d ubiquinol oxidase subunit I
VATSLIVLTALYSVLAVVELALMLRYAKAGPAPLQPGEPGGPPGDRAPDAEAPLSLAY